MIVENFDDFDKLQVICQKFVKFPVFINILTNTKSVMLYPEKVMMDNTFVAGNLSIFSFRSEGIRQNFSIRILRCTVANFVT